VYRTYSKLRQGTLATPKPLIFSSSSAAAAAAPLCHRWSPDGLSVVLVADFCVRMTIWSLVDRKCTYLPGPKHAGKGIAFSPRADQLAVLEVRSSHCH
jgi:hypothetical protein